jgi:hypothetical protein
MLRSFLLRLDKDFSGKYWVLHMVKDSMLSNVTLAKTIAENACFI